MAEQDFQTALALNNIGVSLLERGCYREGLATLQDGIFLMKDLFQPAFNGETNCKQIESTGGSMFVSSNNGGYEIDSKSKLKRAAARLSDARALQTAFPATCSAVENLQIVTYEDTGLAGILEIMGTSPSTSKFFLIRMDVSVEGFVANSPDVESAIILYNFGVAHMLAQRLHQRPPHITDNAHHILHLASSLIARSSDVSWNNLEECVVLQVGLLVLHAIIQTLVETGKDIEAKLVFDRYSTVRQAVQNLLLANQWYTSLLVTAPAA
jgi:hypothetical protein